MSGVLVQYLTDGTVWLSPPTSRDVDVITRLCRHSSIQEWTTMPAGYTRADAVTFVESCVPKGWADGSPTWAIRESQGGDFVGMVGFIHRDESMVDVGYWLGPSARNRGLMTAALELACDFAFRTDGMRMERIEWHAYVGNHPSAAVARRVGFRFEGVARQGAYQRGQRRDCWVAGLLRGDPRTPVDWPEL